MEEVLQQPVQARRQKSESEKGAIVCYSIPYYDALHQRLKYGAAAVLEARFQLSSQSIRDILKEYSSQLNEGHIYPEMKPKRKQPGAGSGPLSDLTPAVRECILEFNAMEGYDLPMREFTTRFNQAYDSTFSSSTMHRYMKQMRFKLRHSFVKPKPCFTPSMDP